jgi:ATP-dependent 26S proteasome regulatory subunit
MEKENKPKETPASGGNPLGDPFNQTGAPGNVTVSVGPYVENLPVAGKTVGEIRRRFKDRLDIDDRSQAILDGNEVGNDTAVVEGMTLMFIHKSGEKGGPISKLELVLSDKSVPLQTKVQLLQGIMVDEGDDAKKVMTNLFNSLNAKNADKVVDEKEEQLAKIIRTLMEGPLRVACFIELMATDNNRARVLFDDGTSAYTGIPYPQMKGELKRGDEVLLDKSSSAILFHFPLREESGEVINLERVINDRYVEVSIRDDRYVYETSQDLSDGIKAGDLKPGDRLVVNEKRKLACWALPPPDGLSHYRYLVRDKVPDVRLHRDIGAPPVCIEDTLDHIRLELEDPGTGREFGVRRSMMRLMAGVSGSGKTLAIQAIWSETYNMISKMTGVPLCDLPPRVFRLRMSEVLSCLLGESDKNLARFFKEVEQMADEEFEYKGKRFRLPVIAIIEEVDGLARNRGMDHDGIYDRILTTALQWLDSTRPELSEKLILYLGTTNEPDTIDRAFLRRIGGTIDKFTRLDKHGFSSVLDKHLNRVPVSVPKGKAVSDVVEWVFGHPDSIEVTYQNGKSEIRNRSHMLTGALVDRAVQHAAKAARREQTTKKVKNGIAVQTLIEGFDGQFVSMIDQLNASNARHYVDVPEGMKVSNVRRVKAIEPRVTIK